MIQLSQKGFNLRVTLSLISINVIVFFMVHYMLNTPFYMAYFGLNYFVFRGFYWQVFTTMFMHGNLLHLLMNMAVLYQFGSVLEHRLGSLKFGLLYIIGGVLTSILSLSYTYFAAQNGVIVNLVGASGAISVLLGFLAYVNPYMRNGLIMAILLMSFVPMLAGMNIGWDAHLFGFGIGYLYAYLAYGRR